MGEIKRIWVECREVAVELVVEYKLDSGRDVVSITNSLFAARVVQLDKVDLVDPGPLAKVRKTGK